MRKSKGPSTRESEYIHVDDIDVDGRHRAVSDGSVADLAASIKSIGLLSPISVRYLADRPSTSGSDDSYVLVTGAHRLAAAKLLGWEKIECFEVDCTDIQA